jgi:ABC-type protease/lipase transport system fused ATPase/permease subunit
VLDEPNSALDVEGDEALNRAIATIKEAGTTVVIVGHRPSTLAQADRILMLREGRLHMFGPRADVIERLTRHQVQAVAPAKTQPVPQTAS